MENPHCRHRVKVSILGTQAPNIGAFTFRIGFWGPLYYNYNKEPPKIVLVAISAATLPVITFQGSKGHGCRL